MGVYKALSGAWIFMITVCGCGCVLWMCEYVYVLEICFTLGRFKFFIMLWLLFSSDFLYSVYFRVFFISLVENGSSILLPRENMMHLISLLLSWSCVLLYPWMITLPNWAHVLFWIYVLSSSQTPFVFTWTYFCATCATTCYISEVLNVKGQEM